MLCFRKITATEKFIDQMGGGESEAFPWKIFCLTMPKSFIREPFIVSLFSGFETYSASEGYATVFCRKFFVSECRKIP